MTHLYDKICGTLISHHLRPRGTEYQVTYLIVERFEQADGHIFYIAPDLYTTHLIDVLALQAARESAVVDLVTNPHGRHASWAANGRTAHWRL